MSRIAAIVVAAGGGTRMGGQLPKVLIPLGGQPMLSHSLRVFARHQKVAELGVVVSERMLREAGSSVTDIEERIVPSQLQEGTLKSICVAAKVDWVVQGGAERQDSVASGLAALSDDVTHVLLQDGARPLVSSDLISRVIEALGSYRVVIPAIPVSDTLRRTDATGAWRDTPDRKRFVACQTPQGFERNTLCEALAVTADPAVTDEGIACERYGISTFLVDGDAKNLKLTNPIDIHIAEALLAGSEVE